MKSIVASLWPSCDGLSLAGLLPGEEVRRVPFSWDSLVVSTCKVHVFLLGLQVAASGGV